MKRIRRIGGWFDLEEEKSRSIGGEEDEKLELGKKLLTKK